METIVLNINAKEYRLSVPRNRTLLKVLREDLHLTGTKAGCETGDCGSCKVLINNQAVNSCTLPAFRANNQRIVTIEGVTEPDGGLNPVQKAFITAGAVQCGFCTPGMIITTLALLARTVDPTEKEIREALDGQICRCTGYVKIVKAIQLAAVLVKEGSKG